MVFVCWWNVGVLKCVSVCTFMGVFAACAGAPTPGAPTPADSPRDAFPGTITKSALPIQRRCVIFLCNT
jgi:hypothetical protein